MGGVLWPISLLDFTLSLTATCGPAGCSLSEASSITVALSVALIALGVVGLELRPRPPLGLLDLIGDLTLGVAAALFLISSLLDAAVFLGSAFLLLLIGGIVFGVEGFRHGARPRWPSVLVAIGAGAVLIFSVVGGIGGQGATGGYEPSVLIGILFFAVGWAWLGLDLLLGRPIAIAGDQPRE